MAKKKTKSKVNQKPDARSAEAVKAGSKNLPLFVTAGVLVLAAIIAVIFGSSGNGETGPSAEQIGTSSGSNVQVIGAGENMIIPLSGITETASFYPVEVDGTQMEVLAIKDSNGNVRTAFNTCQSCYTSGHGYYITDGSTLICQNCGFRFTADQVQTAAGGCNPYPIFEENKTSTDEEISLSYDFLKQSSYIFEQWKNF